MIDQDERKEARKRMLAKRFGLTLDEADYFIGKRRKLHSRVTFRDRIRRERRRSLGLSPLDWIGYKFEKLRVAIMKRLIDK